MWETLALLDARWYLGGIGAIVGLILGSWCTAVVYRLPRRLDVISERSKCPTCRTEISARDNVPVLGWVLLRGRCRRCRTRISVRYPLYELSAGVLGALVFLTSWQLGVTVAVLLVAVPAVVSFFTRLPPE